MAWTDDILEGMQDVPAQASPGDLSTLSSVAARLASATATPCGVDQKRQASPKANEGDANEASTNIFKANACLPITLQFTVPPKHRPGQPVCLQGPHGLLYHNLPQGYQPGDTCSVRLGPLQNTEQIAVPEGKQPGDIIKFEGPDGEELETQIPPGLQPGDVFDATPPSVIVQVPQDAKPGDMVQFRVPPQANVQDTSDRLTKIPKGLSPGQYFAARL